MQMLVETTLQILNGEQLREEFDASRRRLTDATALLTAVIAGEPKKLDGAILHVRRVLSRDISSANTALRTTAREPGGGAIGRAQCGLDSGH
jgi:hypothetical protein